MCLTGRLVHPSALCGNSVIVHLRCVSRCGVWKEYLLLPRFRLLRLPTGLLFQAPHFGRGTASVESVEQLRAALSGPMEHDGALPGLTVLSAVSAYLVARRVLSGPFISGRVGNVFSRGGVDPKPAC